MSIKDTVRNLVPSALLEWNRARKKQQKRRELERKRAAGEVLTKSGIIDALRNAGVDRSKDLLVHSSLSALGFVEGGPAAVVEALIEYLDDTATLLMPTSPVVTLQAKHDLEEFNLEHTPSKMGAITEVFRTGYAHARSAHPLEPVAARGPKAVEYCRGHHTEGTAYGTQSPWAKHMEWGGQILYIGTTLINSGTSLHAVEDAIGWKEFKFPVYLEQSRAFGVRNGGRSVQVITKVHNPEMSVKRECDGLIPLLENQEALTKVKIGEADCLLVDAAKMKSILLKEYFDNGVTMYTPQGS